MRAAAQASQHRHTTPPAPARPLGATVSRLSQRNTTGVPVKNTRIPQTRKVGKATDAHPPCPEAGEEACSPSEPQLTSSLSHRTLLLHLDLLHRRHLGKRRTALPPPSVRHSHLFLACLMFSLNHHPPPTTDPSKLKPGTSVGSSPAPPTRTVRSARPHAQPQICSFRVACWPPQGYTGQLCWDCAS